MVKPGRLFAAGVLLVALTGCSAPTSIAYATYDRAPAGFESAGGLLNGQPGVAWLMGKQSFAVVTFGSSSCPPIPVELSATPPSGLSLRFVPSPNQPCSADMGATTHQFHLPDDMDAAGPIDVHVVYDFPQRTEYDLVLEPGP